jgi:hypothetical protein
MLGIDDLEGRTRSQANTQDEGSSGAGYDALISGPLILLGMKLAANSGGAATFTINDSLTVAGGGTTITLRANANRTTRFNFEPTGIRFATGLSRSIAQDSDTGVISAQVLYVQE